jgi:hypothetical protein
MNMAPRIMRIAVGITAALMVIGAVGTWATAEGLGVKLTVGGTDGGRDGIIVVVCAVILVIAALFPNRGTAFLGILAAIAAAATCIYDLTDIQDTEGITVGWGLWLALVTSVMGVVDMVVLVLMSRRADAEPPITPA